MTPMERQMVAIAYTAMVNICTKRQMIFRAIILGGFLSLSGCSLAYLIVVMMRWISGLVLSSPYVLTCVHGHLCCVCWCGDAICFQVKHRTHKDMCTSERCVIDDDCNGQRERDEGHVDECFSQFPPVS